MIFHGLAGLDQLGLHAGGHGLAANRLHVNRRRLFHGFDLNRFDLNRLDLNRLDLNRLNLNRLDLGRFLFNRLGLDRLDIPGRGDDRLQVVAIGLSDPDRGDRRFEVSPGQGGQSHLGLLLVAGLQLDVGIQGGLVAGDSLGRFAFGLIGDGLFQHGLDLLAGFGFAFGCPEDKAVEGLGLGGAKIAAGLVCFLKHHYGGNVLPVSQRLASCGHQFRSLVLFGHRLFGLADVEGRLVLVEPAQLRGVDLFEMVEGLLVLLVVVQLDALVQVLLVGRLLGQGDTGGNKRQCQYHR